MAYIPTIHTFQDDINENRSRIYEKVHTQQIKNIFIKDIILDCSCINYIDSQGIEAIQWLYENYKKIGISIHLSYCKCKPLFIGLYTCVYSSVINF